MSDIRVDLSKPVVWTTKGNINEQDCETYIQWKFANSAKSKLFRWLLRFLVDGEIVFVRLVKYQGEEVKREPHILKLVMSEMAAKSVAG